jgi:uncharacterized protein YcaQ
VRHKADPPAPAIHIHHSMHLTHFAAKSLMIAAQGLHRRPDHPPTKADVLETIRAMGTLQIDTIHVVARSPYLVLWSRLGAYDPAWLDQLLADGALFEYWSHEACFLPIEDYPLYRHRMIAAGSMGWKYSHAWMEEHREDVDRVMNQIKKNGPTRSIEFIRSDGKSNGWWEWKPEKRALQMLHTAGELMVVRRQNFQRIYDLRKRVLPSWNDRRLPPEEEVLRQLGLKAIRALGVTTERWVADYFRTGKRAAKPLVAGLLADGEIIRVDVEGWDLPAYIHPDNLSLAQSAAAGEIVPELTTLLSPFDPLVWDRERALAIFGFDYRLECYTPEPKRRYGYFTLPILHRGELVGRLDAKAHRKEGRFEVKVIHMEQGIKASAGMLADIAGALHECALWHRTPDVVITRSEPAAIAARLQRALDSIGGKRAR